MTDVPRYDEDPALGAGSESGDALENYAVPRLEDILTPGVDVGLRTSRRERRRAERAQEQQSAPQPQEPPPPIEPDFGPSIDSSDALETPPTQMQIPQLEDDPIPPGPQPGVGQLPDSPMPPLPDGFGQNPPENVYQYGVPAADSAPPAVEVPPPPGELPPLGGAMPPAGEMSLPIPTEDEIFGIDHHQPPAPDPHLGLPPLADPVQDTYVPEAAPALPSLYANPDEPYVEPVPGYMDPPAPNVPMPAPQYIEPLPEYGAPQWRDAGAEAVQEFAQDSTFGGYEPVAFVEPSPEQLAYQADQQELEAEAITAAFSELSSLSVERPNVQRTSVGLARREKVADQPAPTPIDAGHLAPAPRDPEQVRDRYTSFYSGSNRARQDVGMQEFEGSGYADETVQPR